MFDLLGSWRRKRGDQIPLSLDAAIRDATSADPRVRNLALQHLGLVYLQEVAPGSRAAPSPIWRAESLDARGPEIQQILRTAMREDSAPANRAVATASLAQLGDPDLLPTAIAWSTSVFEHSDKLDDDARRYLRECAVIAMTVLGEAAAAACQQHVDAQKSHRAVAEQLTALLDSEFPEVRFQAATGLLDVIGDRAEPLLARALAGEKNPQVAAGLAEALAGMDPPNPESCRLLRNLLEDPNMPAQTTFAAALGLVAARDPAAGPRLLQAVRSSQQRPFRDRALEALAVLGPAAPPQAAAVIHALAHKWLISGSTRVRCAYALSRIDPAVGIPLLQRLEHSRHASVREAVADARAGLDTLARKDANYPPR